MFRSFFLKIYQRNNILNWNKKPKLAKLAQLIQNDRARKKYLPLGKQCRFGLARRSASEFLSLQSNPATCWQAAGLHFFFEGWFQLSSTEWCLRKPLPSAERTALGSLLVPNASKSSNCIACKCTRNCSPRPTFNSCCSCLFTGVC